MNEIQTTLSIRNIDENISLSLKLKEYATEYYGWQEQIPNPENTEEMIDNPKPFTQVIFGDAPMAGFWSWLEEKKKAEKKVCAMQEACNEIEEMKQSVELSVSNE